MNKNELVSSILKSAEDPALKEKLLNNPKEFFENRLNFKLPENFEIAVHEDTPTRLNIVLPSASEELSEVELSAVSGGVCWSNQGDCPNDNCCPSDLRLKKNIKTL